MVRIALVDDNKEFLELTFHLLQECFSKSERMCEIETFSDPVSFLYEVEERDFFDIYFLDVEMPKMNGLELAKKIREKRKRAIIVFLTAHPEFIRTGYEVKAFDYLFKERIDKELPNMAGRLLAEVDESEKRIYIIETNSKFEKIYYEEIIYIYKSGQYARFVLTDKELQDRKALKEVLASLNAKEFIAVERGYSINIEHVRKVDSRNVEMEDGTLIRVSRERVGELKQLMQNHWLERLREKQLTEEKNEFLEQDYQRIMAWSREKNRILHDIRNHFLVLEGLLKNKQTDRAISYIQEIRKSELEADHYIQTDNVVVNALLSEKVSLAKKYNIKVQLSVSNLHESFVSDRDWCVILANLFDNAIEAASQVMVNREIIIKIEEVAYGMVLTMRNTFQGELLDVDGNLVTTKENKEEHGLGFQNVKYAVSKYNGIIQRRAYNNIFQVSVVLYR